MENINQDKRQKVYEVGYLILPSVPEEHVAAEVQNVKNLVEKHGGAFVTEDFPKLRQLAYSMKKLINGRHLKFDKAYFGWVKFETNPVEVPALKAGLEKLENLLRFLLIETVRENTLHTPRPVFRPQPAAEGDAPKDQPQEKISEEQIEKEIENLVVE